MIKYPDKIVKVPLQLFGAVDFYARIAACGTVIIDDTARYDKRAKSTHRFTIADTHGLLQLTVPVSKPQKVDAYRAGGQLTWHDIAISDHAQWWQDVDVSLASAYGRTPFYEFYVDRLRPCFSRLTPYDIPSVAELCLTADRMVRQIAGIDARVIPASETPAEILAQAQPIDIIPEPKVVEYYQVRRQQIGFYPHISILDLIFNLGPETPLILREMINS